MGCVGLTIAGGAFEIVGFGLVAYELARIQRREFGEPKFLVRIRTRLRKIFRRSRHQTVKVGAAVATASGSASVRGRVRRDPGNTFESRVEALERNFQHLEVEFDQSRARLEQSISELRKMLDGMRTELEREREEKDEERKVSLRTSVTLQAWGTGLFVFGAILSVMGNTVSC
jgi:hypothetical protein